MCAALLLRAQTPRNTAAAGTVMQRPAECTKKIGPGEMLHPQCPLTQLSLCWQQPAWCWTGPCPTSPGRPRRQGRHNRSATSASQLLRRCPRLFGCASGCMCLMCQGMFVCHTGVVVWVRAQDTCLLRVLCLSMRTCSNLASFSGLLDLPPPRTSRLARC